MGPSILSYKSLKTSSPERVQECLSDLLWVNAVSAVLFADLADRQKVLIADCAHRSLSHENGRPEGKQVLQRRELTVSGATNERPRRRGASLLTWTTRLVAWIGSAWYSSHTSELQVCQNVVPAEFSQLRGEFHSLRAEAGQIMRACWPQSGGPSTGSIGSNKSLANLAKSDALAFGSPF